MDLPDDILLELIIDMNISEAFKFLNSDTRLSNFTRTPRFLNRFAEIHRLPYSDSLEELKRYAVMSSMDLLSVAARNGDLRVMAGVVDTVPFDDEKGGYWKALIEAAETGHTTAVNMLLEAGVYDYTNKALIDAVRHNHLSMVELLSGLRKSLLGTAMTHAIMFGREDVVNMLIRSSAGNLDLNRYLGLAAKYKHLGIIKSLIEAGATQI